MGLLMCIKHHFLLMALLMCKKRLQISVDASDHDSVDASDRDSFAHSSRNGRRRLPFSARGPQAIAILDEALQLCPVGHPLFKIMLMLSFERRLSEARQR